MKGIFFCLLFLLYSCSRPSYNYPVYGAAEFVSDSYCIRQGKNAILEMEGIEVADLPADAMDEYQDQVTEDDILNIVAYHPTRRELMEAYNYINTNAGGFKVSNGRITLPDIQPVDVIGLTLEEVKIRLEDQLRREIRDIELFITYKDRLTRKVELTGLVSTPTVPVDGKVRLYEVIAKAHIPADANLFMSYVLRNGCPLNVDLHQLIVEGDMCQNIVMQGGDKVHIAAPTDATVMLMGEVARPTVKTLPYGFISLREAIVSAGGIPFWGDKNRIQVIRGNLPCPKIYVLSWTHIINLPNDSLLLMPGDTVYVSATPIHDWNVFINELLPSFTGMQTAYAVYQLSSR